MSEPQSTACKGAEPGTEQMHSALFAQLIMQQANLAMMLLGRVPNPESGETHKDTEAARLFIDQLEMLEAKTRGNLTKDEAGLLKQTLMSLHLAFVEAVDSEQRAPSVPTPSSSGTTPAQPEATRPSASTAETAAAAQDEEHRKKFSKKY